MTDMDTTNFNRKIWPAICAGLIIILDQFTKWLVSSQIPRGEIGAVLWGDLLRITHERNTGIAFSMGDQWPDWVRFILFVILPTVLLVFICVFFWRDKKLSGLQAWGLIVIVAGGFGNIIDRAFKPEGVVDFLSFNLYGFLGMTRFATFNVADTAVNVGAGLIILSLILGRKKKTISPEIKKQGARG